MANKGKTKEPLTQELAAARRRLTQMAALTAECQIIPSAHQVESFYPKR